MYKTCEFTFGGMPSSMYGLMVCDIGGKSHQDNQFGNKANIVETRIGRRVRPIHHGVRYHDEPLRFSLIFGSENEMDRYQLQEVAKWLTGHQDYQWLTIDQPDLEDVRFRCIIESLTPITYGWLPVAFEASIVCDCPYAYGYPFKRTYTVDGSKSVVFMNDGTARARLRPTITITVTSGTEFSIENKTTGETTEFSNLPTGSKIVMDCENCILTDEANGVDLYDNRFNFVFPSFESGTNRLVFTGSASVVIQGECWHNVGA